MPHDEWVLVPRDFLEELARRRDVRGEALRLLFHLMADMDFRNEVAVSASGIAGALGVRRENVHRALRQLRRLGLVRDAGQDRPAGLLRVGPDRCRKVGPKEPRAVRAPRQPLSAGSSRGSPGAARRPRTGSDR